MLTRNERANLRQLYKDAIDIRALKLSYAFLLVGVLAFIGYLVVELATGGPELLLIIFRDLAFLAIPVPLFTILHYYLVQEWQDKQSMDNISQIVTRELNVSLVEFRSSVERILDSNNIFTEVNGIYRRREDIINEMYFSSSTKNIDILATNLQYFRGRILETLIQRVESTENLSVRILAMSPHNDFVDHRFDEVDIKSAFFFRCEILDSLQQFVSGRQRISEKNRDRFQIKAFINSPSVMVFRSDADLVVGFILRQGRSRESLHIRFKCCEDQHCASDFLSHFDRVWHDGNPVDNAFIDAAYASIAVPRQV